MGRLRGGDEVRGSDDGTGEGHGAWLGGSIQEGQMGHCWAERRL